MKHINVVLAQNLKQLREQRKLSLDKVAEMSGISKTMLGQIERSESNPTIATVWKIANGLKISFTALIHEQKSETTVIKGDDVQVLMEENGRVRIYPHFPFEEGRRFEMYIMEMDKKVSLTSEPHVEGAEEFITVFEGELTIQIGTEDYTVKQGESIRFRADKPHTYVNPGPSANKLSLVIHYSK